VEGMNDHSFEIVRFALALHLEIVPDAVVESDSLTEDLGLDPLDLVLVALRLEELAEAEFPVADLEHARTVGDLVAIVREWAGDSQRPSSAFDARPSHVLSAW
jgi:acyl carrier protein